MKRIYILIFLTLLNISLNASQGSIDTVYNYKVGKLINQDSVNPYYPQNIFGLPSRKATRTVPESSQSELLSIGLGGEIIVGFKNKILKNGPGVDFIIFENVFVNNVTKGVFAEPAELSVSQDGINFINFPFDKDSLTGLAGITPTIGTVSPFLYPDGGGDGFDLSDLNLDYIKYIKIKDTTLHITTLDKSNKHYNPEFLLDGFDLDAVLGLYLEDVSTNINDFTKINQIKIDNQNKNLYVNINDEADYNIQIIDINGRILLSEKIIRSKIIHLDFLKTGLYFIKLQNNINYSIQKVLILN